VTGSGKTLAFLIPTIEKLLRLQDPIKTHHVGAIIVSPTRELATQIHSVVESLLRFHPPSAAHLSRQDTEMSDDESALQPAFMASAHKVIAQLLLGGTTTPAQDLAVFLRKSPNLLIATPGRLLELLSSPHVHCPQSSFEMLIMDEADRLLDLGFSDTLQKILGRLPKQKRTGLFSASMSEALDQLVRVGLRNPVRIAVKVKSASGELDRRTPASLQMAYLTTLPVQKLPAMKQLLAKLSPGPQKAVCYLSTCAAVDYWQYMLPLVMPSEYSVVPLHGKHPPNVRTKNFTKFVSSVTPSLLLTTDVAARGLDIPSVDLVIQLDPPSDPKTFLHRCGRAGRAGRRGLAVTFLNAGKEEDYIEFLRIRQTPISPLTSPMMDETDLETDAERFTTKMRKEILRDRALHDKAQKAFVSWVQAYSKHAASSIFSVTDLDWTALGNAWALLRLPKMPELKKTNFAASRGLGLDIDFDTYAYKDKAREQKRIEELREYKAGLADGPNGEKKESKNKDERRKERAWTQKKEIKQTREDRRERKGKKREHERVAKMTDEERVEEAELQRMVEEVRKRGNQEEVEWEGFD